MCQVNIKLLDGEHSHNEQTSFAPLLRRGKLEHRLQADSQVNSQVPPRRPPLAQTYLTKGKVQANREVQLPWVRLLR